MYTNSDMYTRHVQCTNSMIAILKCVVSDIWSCRGVVGVVSAAKI